LLLLFSLSSFSLFCSVFSPFSSFLLLHSHL
jgi:hypothetical protein